MAINITKYTRYIPWDEEGIGASRRRASSSGIKIDLSQYYTISQLQTIGQSQILFDNIIEAYHNKMLGLQGGLVIEDSSETPSGAGDDEFYHLDAETYSRVIIWEFLDSLIEESDGTIHLVNDENDPGILKYYGTDISGIKGWFDLPEAGSSSTPAGESLWQEDSIGDLIPITVGAGIEVDGIFIKNRAITSIDNGLGDGTGDLSLLARNGAIYLVPGYDDDSEGASNYGAIFLGDKDYPQDGIDFKAKGVEDDIHINIFPKGWGNLGLGDHIGYQTTIFSNGWYHYFRSNEIYLGIPESVLHDDENRVYIRPDYAYNYSGKSVWLLAGSSSSFAAGLDGGDLYLMAGLGSVGGSNRGGHIYINSGYAQAGTHGDIFFGYDGTGCLPEADSDEVYGVTYDPVTGKLSYAYLGGIGSGGSGTPGWVDVYGTPPTNPSSGEHEIAVWYDADTITYIDGFKTVQWVGGYNILHAPFGSIIGGEYAWKSAPYYLNDRFAITALDGDETYPNGTNILIWSGQCWSGGGLSGKIRIHVSDSISTSKARDLELIGGTNQAVDGGNGGDVYIESGYCFSDVSESVAGDIYISTGYKCTYEGNDILSKGFIYFGDKYEGCLPEADSDEVYGVTYDPVTGKLSYAYLGSIGSGGEGVTPYNFGMSLLEDSSGVVTLENDEASPGNDQYYGTNSSGTKGWYASTKSFQTASFANPLNIDCTTYKDWICTVTGDCTINLNNANDGDAGMLELIIDASGVDITMGAMWTKKMGPTDLDTNDGADNIISWRAIGEGSTQEIVYTVGIIEV